MLHIGSVRQLFLDDLLIERMEGCHRQLHRPVRHPANPVLRPDRPWELGPGRNGTYLFGGTVLFDEAEGRFRMWYRSSEVEPSAIDASKGIVPPGGYRSGYATSADGILWEKPDLGFVSYGTLPRTNILPPGPGETGYIRRPNLIVDYEEPDPTRRYKMVYANEVDGRWLLEQAYSPDGIRWQMGAGRPVFFPPPLSPLGILFGWDPLLGAFVHLHRQTSPGVPADVDGRLVRAEVALMRSLSRDFENWSEPEEVLRRDEERDPPGWDIGHAGLLTGSRYTDDLAVGFLDTALPHDVADVPASSWEAFREDHAVHRSELVISRDGLRWTRVAPHWEFMRPGLWGEWDREFVVLSKPIVRNDEILIYYTGRNVSCGAQLVGHPQRAVLGTMHDGQPLAYAIGLATMRLDGFASIDGYEDAGRLTTRPFTFAGSELVVNARAPGRLTVSILDGDGQTLPGYSDTACDPFIGDDLRHRVTWRGSGDVGSLAGRPVRLAFTLRNAALHAFQFRSAGTDDGAGLANLLAPGSRGRPAHEAR